MFCLNGQFQTFTQVRELYRKRAMSDVLKARKRNKPKYVPRFLGSAVVVEFPGICIQNILETSDKDNKVNCNNLAKYKGIIQFKITLITQNHSYSNKYIGYQTLSFGTRSDSKMIYQKDQPNFEKTLQRRTHSIRLQ